MKKVLLIMSILSTGLSIGLIRGAEATSQATKDLFESVKVKGDKEIYAKFMKAIKAGADVNAKDSEGQTPLMRLAQNSNSPTTLYMIDELIKAGAKKSIDEKDKNGNTAANFAAQMLNMEFSIKALQKLRLAGADFSIKNDKRISAQDIIIFKGLIIGV